LEESFERLQVEKIDLYYLHRVRRQRALAENSGADRRGAHGRRIANVGLSEVSVEQILLGRSVVPIVAVQNEYSLQQRKHDEVVDFCAEQGIVFVPSSRCAEADRRPMRSPSVSARPRSRSSSRGSCAVRR